MPLEGFRRVPTVGVTWAFRYDQDEVWDYLVDRELLPEWLGRWISGSFTAGRELVVEHAPGYRCTSEVQVAEPGQRLSMSWWFPDEPRSHVDIRLRPVEVGEGSVLELTHSGLGEVADSYVPGWITHLTYFEASIRGAPIHSENFWALHGSFERLVRG